ncbi:MAG TPA: septal ring lytic transglycosylase RlpA family protein [Acidimicrobiales bacterium]|nr:septal ring lytic transglycosylase RlpA family protein [Acidimicrobiales bacterium]
MVLVPLVSLAAVHDAAPTTAPSGVRVDAVAPRHRDGTSDEELARERLESALGAERASRSAELAAPATEASTTTEAPTTTAAPATTAKPTTTTAKATTTTARATEATPKPTTTTAAPTTTAPPSTTTAPPSASATGAPPCCRQEGGASYHDYPDVRTCAHRSLPRGTALKVTNLADGRTTSCVVNDRGPYVEGRILDLSREAFAEIAAISDGVIRVSIEW